MKRIKDRLKERIALLRLRKGDTEAFGFIYDSYVDRIFRYVSLRIPDKGTAHDITQEVFLQTWEYIVSHKEVQQIQPFMYRIAYHKVVDFYRERERQTTLITDLGDGEQVGADTEDTQIEMHFLRKRIRELKPEYQDIIILKHIENLSIQEIADILEKDMNNVRVTLHRAMNALKALHATVPPLTTKPPEEKPVA